MTAVARKVRLPFALLFSGLLLCACGGVRRGVPPPIRGPGGALAETVDFTLDDLQGEPVQLSSFRGRVVLVSFFATWCGPCLQELPAIDRLAAEEERLTVLAVSLDNTPKKLVPAFVNYLNFKSKVVLADRGMMTGNTPFGPLPAIPVSFLVDARGRHVETFFGLTPTDYVRRRVDELGGGR